MRDGVRADHKEKREGVRVDNKKQQWGDNSPLKTVML